MATTRRRALALLGAVLAAALCGCQEELPSYYGSHQLPTMSASVNGTDVLANMFREAGHDVYFRRTLVTTEMEAADTVVWFPDDYQAPREEVCEWFEDWLFEKPGRTLVYVGRDFDAAPLYWKQMLSQVGADQKEAYEVRDLDARLGARSPTDIPVEDLDCQWFRLEPGSKQPIEQLGGPWAGGVDVEEAQIQLGTNIIPSRLQRRLLTTDGNPLVSRFSRRYWEGGKILLVANGSFLLNLPLVNHQHRKLAGKLIEAVGEPGHVVFLESDYGGPPIDPPYTDSSLWTLFGAWPLNVILLQLAVAGVIFCFARWPIFGRPKRPPAEETSDFARHVAAVGELLSRTKDRNFAHARASQAEPQRGGPSVAAAPVSPLATTERAGAPSPPADEKGN